MAALTALTGAAAHAGSARTLTLPVPDPANPLGWLAGVGVNLIGDAVITVLSAIWQAGLWLMQLAFRAIDAFTTPDLSGSGPLRVVLPTTLWLGGFMAVLMLFVQIGLALVRRDGQSIGRVLLGIAQFGFVWLSFLTVAAGVVAACAGLERGILSATLHVDTLAAWNTSSTWPREVSDVGAAAVLALTSLLLLIPASFTDLLVALVRDAALLVLVGTAPVSAAGLLSEVGRAWFWKTLRWFIAGSAIAPLSALVLGLGVGVSQGVVSGAGDSTAQAIGTGVVGAALVMVAATAPLVLFRLLAFVEPSSVSGAAMRQAWADAGGLFGGGASAGTGSGAAATGDGGGRSQGEATAASATQSRISGLLGLAGQGIQMTTSISNRAVDLSTDILGSAGVGSPGYSMTPADERALRASRGSGGGGQASGDDAGGDPGQGPGTPPTPPAPSGPPMPAPAGPSLPGSGAGSGSGTPPGASGGSAGAGAASAAEAGLVIA